MQSNNEILITVFANGLTEGLKTDICAAKGTILLSSSKITFDFERTISTQNTVIQVN